MRKRTLRPGEASQITEKTLFKIADDLRKGIPPLPKLSVVDDLVVGLRFIIYKDASIAMHASYTVGDRRPFFKIGVLNPKDPDHLSLTDARQLVKDIKAIGDRGIDVQDGMMRRLIKEIQRDGSRWTPALCPPAKSGRAQAAE
jgi:hypothetical protein